MKLFGGTLSILSGNGELHLSDSKQDRLKTDFHWQGTAIGFQIFIPTDDIKLNDSNVELEKLAERMGI